MSQCPFKNIAKPENTLTKAAAIKISASKYSDEFRKCQDDLIKACLELAMGGVTCDMYRYKVEEWSVVGVQ